MNKSFSTPYSIDFRYQSLVVAVSVAGAIGAGLALGMGIPYLELAFLLLIALLWMVRFPFAGLLVLLFAVMIEEAAVVFPGLTISRLLGPAVLLVFLLQPRWRNQLRWRNLPKPLALILIWLGYGMLSVVWSYDRSESVERLLTGIQLFLLMVLVVGALDTRKRAQQAMIAIGLGAVAMTLIGLLFVNTNTYFLEYGRVSGSDLQSATSYAAISGIGVIIFSVMALYAGVRWLWLYIILGMICLMGVFASGGRGAMVGLLVVGGLLLYGRRQLSWRMVISTLVLGLLAVAAWKTAVELDLLSSSVLYRLQPEVIMASRISGRSDIWKAFLLYIFPMHPFLGFGFGAAPHVLKLNATALMMQSQKGLEVDTHNGLLYTLISMGIVGLLIWLSIYWHIAKNLFLVRVDAMHQQSATVFYWAAVSLFVYVIIIDFSITYTWTKPYWVALAFAIAAARMMKSNRMQDNE